MFFQINMFEIQNTNNNNRNPYKGFLNRKKRIRNIGAISAAKGKIHLPLKKNRQTNPINK